MNAMDKWVHNHFRKEIKDMLNRGVVQDYKGVTTVLMTTDLWNEIMRKLGKEA